MENEISPELWIEAFIEIASEMITERAEILSCSEIGRVVPLGSVGGVSKRRQVEAMISPSFKEKDAGRLGKMARTSTGAQEAIQRQCQQARVRKLRRRTTPVP